MSSLANTAASFNFEQKTAKNKKRQGKECTDLSRCIRGGLLN